MSQSALSIITPESAIPTEVPCNLPEDFDVSLLDNVLLVAIARAYDDEVMAYGSRIRAHRALPRSLHSPALVGPAPWDVGPTGFYSEAARMLAKYVEHVFEQASKAQEVMP